jgi:hypothetical protein
MRLAGAWSPISTIPGLRRIAKQIFCARNDTLTDFLADGFVRVNDLTEQLDNGVESPTDDATIGYYVHTKRPAVLFTVWQQISPSATDTSRRCWARPFPTVLI